MKTVKLTEKQESFCQCYVRTGNASEAYRKAGYSCKSKNPETVHQLSCRLLKTVNVASRVSELQAIAAEVADKEFAIDSKEILKQLKTYAEANIDDYVEYVECEKLVTSSTGRGRNKVTTTETVKWMELRFKPFDKLTKEQKSCIESVKQGKYGLELKLHGKQWTLDMINKHIGLYEKDNQQKQPEITNVLDMAKMSTETLKAIQAAYVKPAE